MPRTALPSEINRQIGKRLRSKRIKLGVRQRELAAILGVSYQQVQKYEKGKNRISAAILYIAADALEVPIAWFFEDPADPMPLISASFPKALTHQWAWPDRYFSVHK